MKLKFASITPKGFTLIELLVTVSIMMLLIGGGIASYLDFADRQNILADAQKIRSLFEEGRIRARAGDIATSELNLANPEDCNKLDGYYVNTYSAGNFATLRVYCRDITGTVRNTYEVKREVLGYGNSFASDLEVYFKPLGQGVLGSGTVTINSDDYTYRFEISSGGAIGQGEFVKE